MFVKMYRYITIQENKSAIWELRPYIYKGIDSHGSCEQPIFSVSLVK